MSGCLPEDASANLASRSCLSCEKPLQGNKKYCDNRCQQDFAYKRYIESWLAGKETGRVGSSDYISVSKHIRRYLIETLGERCTVCSWDVKHLTTGRVPIVVEHKDGNPKNNSPKNLTLLCPNCHSLTATFGGLNRGFGRKLGASDQTVERPSREIPTCACGVASRRRKCRTCSGAERRREIEELPDNVLREYVWQQPIATLAKQLGISGTALRERCLRRGIKVPPRGYWEKIRSKKGTIL